MDPFRTERLIFQSFNSPDHDEFFHEIQSDPIAFANASTSIPRPVDRKFSEEQRKWHLDNALLFVVICRRTLKQTTTSSSSVGLSQGSLESEDEPPKPVGILFLESAGPDEAHHRCSALSIDIKRSEQGQGYATEALIWALDWAFHSAGLHRVELEYLGWNSRVRNLYERLGFREEGRRRERFYKDGKWWDEVYMGILKTEWEQQVGARPVKGQPLPEL